MWERGPINNNYLFGLQECVVSIDVGESSWLDLKKPLDLTLKISKYEEPISKGNAKYLGRKTYLSRCSRFRTGKDKTIT